MRSEPFDCEWQARGLLFVFQTRKAMDHYAETDHLLRTSFNMPAERYDGDALLSLEPALKPGLAGAWHYRTDAHLRPDHLMTSWRQVLETHGVIIRENCPVKGFKQENGRARAVITGQGEWEAEAF